MIGCFGALRRLSLPLSSFAYCSRWPSRAFPRPLLAQTPGETIAAYCSQSFEANMGKLDDEEDVGNKGIFTALSWKHPTCSAGSYVLHLCVYNESVYVIYVHNISSLCIRLNGHAPISAQGDAKTVSICPLSCCDCCTNVSAHHAYVFWIDATNMTPSCLYINYIVRILRRVIFFSFAKIFTLCGKIPLFRKK